MGGLHRVAFFLQTFILSVVGEGDVRVGGR